MDAATLHARTIALFESRVETVAPEQWTSATPCTDWNVHDLVNHVVGEELWAIALLHGETLEDVGDRFDGDVLGPDPLAVCHAAAAGASAAGESVSEEQPVQLSYGPERAGEYLRQLAADHLVHAWDLAVATQSDPRLDPDLVGEVATWFGEREELYRSAGMIGPRGATSGDAQADLLAAFGRDPRWARAEWSGTDTPT